jgi:hypothetical protein
MEEAVMPTELIGETRTPASNARVDRRRTIIT